jgi:hypothetical protein
MAAQPTVKDAAEAVKDAAEEGPSPQRGVTARVGRASIRPWTQVVARLRAGMAIAGRAVGPRGLAPLAVTAVTGATTGRRVLLRG